LAIFLCFGWVGLAAFLLWQLIFIITLLYLNYLQHFATDVGNGVLWTSAKFNRCFVNIGFHDQHHANPAATASQLPSMTTLQNARAKVGIFNPIVFTVFLFSPKKLKEVLLS
jgi:hypothetical protein